VELVAPSRAVTSRGGMHRGCSQKLLVPLALRGRPVCWSQIIRGRSNAVLLGWRLGVNPTASVPAASFIKLMLDKCTDAERMWGCAFAYDVPSQQDHEQLPIMFSIPRIPHFRAKPATGRLLPLQSVPRIVSFVPTQMCHRWARTMVCSPSTPATALACSKFPVSARAPAKAARANLSDV
jgi:hypothetical protein